jgi:hypothetical protein
MMRCGAIVVAILFLVFPLMLKSQVWEDEDSRFDTFYGRKSFQEIDLGISPWFSPGAGLAEEVDFGFNTLSRKSSDALHWMNYYGLSIDLKNWDLREYEFSRHGTRDISAYSGSMILESKFFYRDDSRVRPYIGVELGAGLGEMSLSEGDDEEDDDDPLHSRLDLYQVGIEAGVHIMINDRFGLVIADTTSYGYGVITGDSFQVFQTTICLGISGWREKGY